MEDLDYLKRLEDLAKRKYPHLIEEAKQGDEEPEVTLFNSIIETNRVYVADILNTGPDEHDRVTGVFAIFQKEQFDKLHQPELGQYVFPNEQEAQAFTARYHKDPSTIEYLRPQPVYSRKLLSELNEFYTVNTRGEIVVCTYSMFEYQPHWAVRSLYSGLFFKTLAAALEYKGWLEYLELPYDKIVEDVSLIFS